MFLLTSCTVESPAYRKDVWGSKQTKSEFIKAGLKFGSLNPMLLEAGVDTSLETKEKFLSCEWDRQTAWLKFVYGENPPDTSINYRLLIPNADLANILYKCFEDMPKK